MFLGQFALFSVLLASALAFLNNYKNNNNNKNADEIKQLPGLGFIPNFKHYSGYLNVSSDHQLFYWLVTSQHNSSSDPLIFWFNGGPGCSSLIGILAEHGPYLVTREGDKLVKNEASWNRQASVVYVESPAFVGYSVPGNNVNASDRSTATENYEAMKQFFLKFPEYRHAEVFITGESYGGIYLPTLAERIVEGQWDYKMNFKGMAIGNGLMNWTLHFDTENRFYYGHGMIDEVQWQRVRMEQCNGNIDECDLSKTLFFHPGNYHHNRYDLFDTCRNGQARQLRRLIASELLDQSLNGLLNLSKTDERENEVGTKLICENEHGLDTYLNREDVRKALHVSAKKERWMQCSGHGFYKKEYLRGSGHMVPQKKGPEILHVLEAFLQGKPF